MGASDSSRLTLSLFAGHSGGHLFPALAFAEAFKSRYPQSRLGLVSSIKAKPFVMKMPSGIFDEAYFLPEFPSPAGFSLESLKFLIQLALGFILSWQYLSRFKPGLCIGFGSYAAYPGLVLASLRKIPTLIHEQNLVPGKATSWLVPHADLVALTFEGTFEKRTGFKKFVTGLPIRRSLCRQAESAWKLRMERNKRTEAPGIFRLIAVGGSQGASGLNQLILDAISYLRPEEKKKLAVIHITGEKDYDRVREEYKKMEFPAEIYPFSEKMNELYENADLAITRAGANTLFELALFGTPALVIPYPYAGAHQADNAYYFESRNAVMMSLEKDLSGNQLALKLRNLMNEPEKLRALSESIHSISVPDAANRLVNITEELLN